MKTKIALWALVAGVASGGVPVIGTVTASGAFRLDNSTDTGNATLLEGATVETKAAVSSLVLAGRARVTLAPESRARFYGDRMILEKGSSRMERATGFRLEALGLTVQPGGGSAVANVAVAAARLRVAAVSGPFRVLNGRGVLVAEIAPGTSLDFEPQAASGPTKLS